MENLIWWAKHGKSQIGPFSTREIALASMGDRLCDKYPNQIRKHEVLTGYGKFGPQFDMQWVKAATLVDGMTY